MDKVRTLIRGVWLVLVGLLFLFYYLVVWFLLSPIKILSFFGGVTKIQDIIRKPLVISDTQARKIRNDLANDLTEGTERILEYNNIEGIPVSRHVYRQHGLEAVRQSEAKISSGEFLVSVLVVFLGVSTSIAPSLSRYLPLNYFGGQVLPGHTLSILSITTALIGLLILVLVSLRNSLVNHLTYSNAELSVGSAPEELLMKVAWNQFVAENPAKILKLYYAVLFAKAIGDAPYLHTREILVAGMDPEMDKWTVLAEEIPKLVSSIEDTFKTDTASSH